MAPSVAGGLDSDVPTNLTSARSCYPVHWPDTVGSDPSPQLRIARIVNPMDKPHRTLSPWIGLLLWMAVGTGIRLVGLGDKPLWTDEFATLVFSLGQSFRTIPLDQVITAGDLLAPVQAGPTSAAQVVTHLLDESNHPPLYFVLTHVWLRWGMALGLDLAWAGRSLAAGFGVLCIPAIYGLTWMVGKSQRGAQVAAGLMALSPFAVYLSQEARHYTLPMLWIMASLVFWLRAVRSLRGTNRFTYGDAIAWIGVNSLGLATHYFMALTLVIEAIALGVMGMIHRTTLRRGDLGRMGMAVWGTLVGGAVWLPWLVGSHDSELTRWIYQDNRTGLAWLDPLGQAIAGWITLIYLLPIQAGSTPVVILSAVGMLGLTGGTVAVLWHRRHSLGSLAESDTAALALWVAIAAALFLAITYGLGMDLTSAFRYNFVYFPVVLVVVALGLEGHAPSRSGLARSTVAILLAVALGGLTVVTNLGYQKTHRPDVVVDAIYAPGADRSASDAETLVAIAHRTHGQTGRLMAIAWDGQRRYPTLPSPQFLLAHQTQPMDAVSSLARTLSDRDRPLTLWLINMQTVPPRPLAQTLAQAGCVARQDARSVDGYRYQPFTCDPSP
jgi:uncharacterized membrane protein